MKSNEKRRRKPSFWGRIRKPSRLGCDKRNAKEALKKMNNSSLEIEIHHCYEFDRAENITIQRTKTKLIEKTTPPFFTCQHVYFWDSLY